MRSEAPGLLPVLRSRHQVDLLTLLLLHPKQDYTIAELARRLSIPQSTVSVEVQRLMDAGILAARAAGRARIVRADPDSPLVAPLTELLILTFGPKAVVADEFAELDAARSPPRLVQPAQTPIARSRWRMTQRVSPVLPCSASKDSEAPPAAATML